ncbi:threonine ammonia-lyase IlvA [bacterium]|nr:MAG: threonine ammonia-lyase IlvA [bacterium]
MPTTVTKPTKQVAVMPADITAAARRLAGTVVKRTPLEYSERLSGRYGAHIYLKREDQQTVRSYKIRGALNLMAGLTDDERARGAVTASAGNHAQGVALAAAKLQIKTVIFIPSGTPPQKVSRIRHFGGDWVELRLVGKTFDESLAAALKQVAVSGAVFVHPFDDPRVIAGQGTVGLEIHEQLAKLDRVPDLVVAPIGGGGLISGIGTYLRPLHPQLRLIGVEPAGAPAMQRSLDQGTRVTLTHIDKFVDGAAVNTVGRLTFEYAQSLVDQVYTVPEGKTCTTMIELYQNDGIIAEPAGALATSALDQLAGQIGGQTVVVVISGGNNDVLRYPEILEKSLAYEGLKHYLLVEFEQKPGQLRQFVDQALGESDDITRFEYIKKTNKDRGAALVGIEVAIQTDYAKLLDRLDRLGVSYRRLDQGDLLYSYLV